MSDATGDPRWLDQALAMDRRFGHDIPEAQGGFLPEHFSPGWEVLPDYRANQPADDTRPFGLTPGHHAEWGGLLLKGEAACKTAGRPAPDWLLSDTVALFGKSIELRWAPDANRGWSIPWVSTERSLFPTAPTEFRQKSRLQP